MPADTGEGHRGSEHGGDCGKRKRQADGERPDTDEDSSPDESALDQTEPEEDPR